MVLPVAISLVDSSAQSTWGSQAGDTANSRGNVSPPAGPAGGGRKLGTQPIQGVTSAHPQAPQAGCVPSSHAYEVGAFQVLVHNSGQCLVRFGQKAETASELAADAARAVANGFPHGVATKLASRVSGSDKLHKYASLEDVKEAFEVAQTGNRKNHFTVFLPKPVTDEVAILFNRIFKPKA